MGDTLHFHLPIFLEVVYKAVVKSDGNQNVKFEKNCTVGDDLQKTLKQKFDLKDSTEVFNEIHEHLQKCSGKNWSDYYVGTSDEPKQQLTNIHKVPTENSCWIFRKALCENDAFLAKKTILEKGAKGNSENNQGLYVYCYQITNNTKQ